MLTSHEIRAILAIATYWDPHLPLGKIDGGL